MIWSRKLREEEMNNNRDFKIYKNTKVNNICPFNQDECSNRCKLYSDRFEDCAINSIRDQLEAIILTRENK